MTRQPTVLIRLTVMLALVLQVVLPVLPVSPPPVAFAAEVTPPAVNPPGLTASASPTAAPAISMTSAATQTITPTLNPIAEPITPPLTITPTVTTTPAPALPLPTPLATDTPLQPEEPVLSPPGDAMTTWPAAGFQIQATDASQADALPDPDPANEQPTLPPLTLEFSADAQPRRVAPGDVLTYTISAIHTGHELLRDVTIADILPAGVVFVPESATNFTYAAREQTLTWSLAELQPGAVVTGTFQVRAQGLRMGEAITNTLTAASPAADGTARGGVVVDIVPPPAKDGTSDVTPNGGGWLRAADGRIEVQLPRGAAKSRQRLTHFPGAGSVQIKMPEGQRYAFTLNAVAETGEIVARSQAPLKLVYPLSAAELRQHAHTPFTFYAWDAATLAWQPLPTQVDALHRTLTASTDTFTTYSVVATAAATGNSASYQFDPGSRIKGTRPQLFSGSISYDYGFELPPGRGGMTPVLGLDYSSARHQRETGHFNFAGHGWDILGENYAGKADPEHPESSALTVVLNGATYTINTSNPWFFKENPFIQAWEYATPCINGVNGTCPAWLGSTNFPYYRLRIRTSDGTRYTFQGIALASSAAPVTAAAPPMIYRWRDNVCSPGTGGLWPDLVRLPLVEVARLARDSSNSNNLAWETLITYNWEATASNAAGYYSADDTWQEDHNCNYVRTVRLKDIRYNYVGTNAQTIIELRYDNGLLRRDRPQYFPVKNMSLYAIAKLLGVDVRVRDGANELQTVRQYNLTYHDQCAGGCGVKASMLLLPSQIQETVGGTSLVTAFNYDANKELTTQCDFGYLNTVTGPYGGKITFAATKQTVDCANPRPPAVTSHTVTDLVTGQAATWNYSMTGWDQKAHGYSQVNVLAPDLGDGTRRLEQHTFLQMTTLGSEQIDHLAGRESQTITCLPQSASPSAACATVLQKTTTSWQHSTADLPLNSAYIYLPADQQPRFVYADSTETWVEGQRLLRTDSYYQTARQGSSGKQYGNVTEQRERTGTTADWNALPERTRYFWYYPTTDYWIFNKLAQTHLYKVCADTNCAGTQIAASQYFYDGATSVTTTPIFGQLTKQIDGMAGTQTTTQYTYWSNGSYTGNGNPRQVMDDKGRTTETFYDSRFLAYPVCVKNAKGQTAKQRYYGVPGSTDAGCTTTAGDAAWSGTTPVAGRFFGQLQDETDANSIVTSTYRWDSQGRISKVIRPGDDDTNPTLRFGYTAYTGANQPFWVKQEARDNAPGAATSYLETRTFYDGLGQVLQTQSEGISGAQSSIASTQYNADGQVVKQNAPYFGGALGNFVTPDWTKPSTQTTYDALGRPKVVTAPDGMASETNYRVEYNSADPDFSTPRLSVYSIDANRYFVRRASDAFGNLRSVSESTGSWPVGQPNPTWGSEYRARYAYNVAGSLTDVWDAANNHTGIGYDSLGRKTAMNDPDMGAWTYAYDSVGNLTRQTDARGQTICFFYDELNRLKGKTYRTDTNCPTTDPGGYIVSFTYDSTANGNKGAGRRTGMSSYWSGSTSWVYDDRGRVTSETKTVDGTNYVTDTVYDSADRPATLTYPADASSVREVVAYTYDPAAQLTQLRSTTNSLNYASGLTYNALGQTTQLTYGNNVQERRGYYGLGGNWDSRPGAGLLAYGKLWRIQAQTAAAGAPLLDLRYNYDNVGNISRSQEAPRSAGNWPTTYTFQDSFDSKNTTAWTWSSQQTVPFSDGGNNVVKSAGTGSNWNATFYRSAAALSTGQGLSVRFKVDSATANALWAIETPDSAKRFAILAQNGKLFVQYNDGGGWRYPTDLITALQANTWYVARIVMDDVRGFYLEVYQESAPTVRGSYQQWLPTGQAWRFRHWIYSGTAYLDDYREFSTAGLTWNVDERMNYGYDALNRLTSTWPDSGAAGYSHTYGYAANGNITSRTDVGSYTYPTAGQARPHAATAAGANTYSYDANGNMLTRAESGVTYTQTWDEENRLQTVTVVGQTTTYTYDGDGQRVKKVQGGQTTVYIGNYYEKNLGTGVVTKYYYAGGQRVAQRQGSTVYYFTGDHLGSTSLTTNASGGEVGRQKYYPFGAARFTSGALATDYRFTGQRSEEGALGSLYDYGARFYSPLLGRFISADSIVPRPGDPQSLNRYSYVRNNPVRLVDPSGNAECAAGDTACWQSEWEWKDRWYRAHGYDSDGNRINPEFKDEGIARDVLGEAGIQLTNGRWASREIMEMAHGVALFGQKLDRGLAQLRELLGASVRIRDWGLCGTGCAPPANVLGSWELWFPAGRALNDVAGLFVHELAHVIDWNSSYSFSARWGYKPLTEYARDNNAFYPQSWDRWAEAVAVWVMGEFDAAGTFAIKGTYPVLGPRVQDFNVQLSRMSDLMNGRR